MQHLIACQRFELKLSDRDKAFELQQHLSSYNEQKLAPAMAELFDKWVGPSEVLRFERLEIDLGHLSFDQLFQGNWETLLLLQLENVLKSHSAGPNNGAAHQQFLKSQYRFDQWLHFLEYGQFAWEGVLPPRETLYAELLEFIEKDPAGLPRLRQKLIGNPAALRRLVLQHPVDFLLEILKKSSHSNSTEPMKRVLEAWKNMFNQPSHTRAWDEAVQNTVLPDLRRLLARVWGENPGAEDSFFTASPAFTRAHIARMERHAEVWALAAWLFSAASSQRFDSREHTCWQLCLEPLMMQVDLKSWLAAVYHENTLETPQVFRQFLEQNYPEVVKPKSAKLSTSKTTDSETPAASPFPAPIHRAKSATYQADRQSDVSKQEVSSAEFVVSNGYEASLEPETAWYVPNAGLVILNPFLVSFFERLSLLNDEKCFVDEWSRQQAALCLHYLATGETRAEESAMLVPKLLCGMPLHHYPIDGTLEINPEQAEEAEALLEAVVEHWGALGNTSPDGLREGFLQRAGKVQTHDLGFNMKIECQTLDILLNQMPWGFGTIKLPWMPQLMVVEWNIL